MKKSNVKEEFAILAPVPHVHLESGKENIVKSGKVAFGTDQGSGTGLGNYELLEEIQGLSEKQVVKFYIISTHNNSSQMIYEADFVSYCSANGLQEHPKKEKYRPASTLQNNEKWQLFWEVKNLVERPDLKLNMFQSLKSERYLSSVPRTLQKVVEQP